MLAKQIHLECSALVFDVENHAEKKDKILQQINDFSEATSYVDISRSDWDLPASVKRPYYDLMVELLNPVIQQFVDFYGYKSADWCNYWFQQYENGDWHDVHTHPGTMFSVVYYIELPDDAPSTELYVSGEKVSTNAKEGQVLIFPSILYHSSPKNNSERRKTIIATNLNVW